LPEKIQGGGAAEERMGLLQPACLGQVGELRGLHHLGQAIDHTVGAIGVERPEWEALFPLIKNTQQVTGPEAIVHHLATTGSDGGRSAQLC
jgi:hypothetical protein